VIGEVLHEECLSASRGALNEAQSRTMGVDDIKDGLWFFIKGGFMHLGGEVMLETRDIERQRIVGHRHFHCTSNIFHVVTVQIRVSM
jgi:hypothetical protein